MASYRWVPAVFIFSTFLCISFSLGKEKASDSPDVPGAVENNTINDTRDPRLRVDSQNPPHEETSQDAVQNTETPANRSYNDTTDFVVGVNGWNFMGSWAKYDLAQMHPPPIPRVPEDSDQGVFICQTAAFTSLLDKEFQAMENVSFLLTYYVASSNRDLSMVGEVLGAGNKTQKIFNYAFPDDLLEQNNTWVTQIFRLHNFTGDGKFKVRLAVRSNTTGVWAVSVLQIMGVLPPPPTPVLPPPPTPVHPATQPPDNTTTQITVNATTAEYLHNATTGAPLVNATTGAPLVNATTEEFPFNATTEAPLVNATTEESLLNATTVATNESTNVIANGTNNGTSTAGSLVTNNTSTNLSETGAQVEKLASVAQAIWDAFYVFLALFCACLVALVALLVHGRCKEDEPPPAVATYNPRTASYRLDKVYDNPAYENSAA
nr:uncharacterized protein LOC123763201 isoform X1 [Procambarus clarkii]XP_045606184.1 uncharacterized protein LOC123763201 isoform X1 [Procambarus clarkii]